MSDKVYKNTDQDKLFQTEFLDKIVVNGRITTLLAALLTFLPALYLWFGQGIKPTWAQIGAGWLNIVAVYFIIYIVEPISYYPVLGLSGIYIGYLAGNVPSVRLPALMAAQAATGTEQGTYKGEIVGTIAMGSSVFVNLIFVTLAAIAGQYILAILPEFFINAFNFTLPAILGGVMAQFAVKNPSFVGIILIVGFAIQISPMATIFKFPLAILASLVISYYQYQYRKRKSGVQDQQAA